MVTMHPETQILSFVSAALSLVPLVWYFHARNIAAIAIGIWLSITNLTYAVDALIWAGETDIRASVWCDISTSLITGSRIALPAASLSICVHLERLACFCQTSTPTARLRRIIFECLMCFGLPLLYIALHLVVQPRRFDLFDGFGCRPATYPAIATIFLVMIPPLLLTVATITSAVIAWRQFLVHGVQFYGKRGSISSLTRNLYLRLVGMALSQAMISAILITVVMWGVLSPGLAPIQNISRDLNEVLVWGPEAITNTDRTILEVEWSLTVVQSIVFVGLFACRMEVVRDGWQMIRPLLQWMRGTNASRMFGHGTCESSSTSSTTVQTLPLTEVDLSLVIQSASTLAPYGWSMDKSLTLTPRPSVVHDTQEDIVISPIKPVVLPPESPSRASAIASSHNSLASNFDTNWTIIFPGEWPHPPTSVPARLSLRSLSMGNDVESPSRFDVQVPFPRARVAAHVGARTALFHKPLTYRPENRQAMVFKETQ